MTADQGMSFNEAESALEEQSNAPELQSDARAELGDDFGGVWVDNSDDATVKLGVVADEAGALSEARSAAAGSGTAAEVVVVEHSYAELEAVIQWLASRLASAGADTEYPLNFGIRTDQNVVSLEVPEDSPLTLKQQDILEEATARFGSMIHMSAYEGKKAELACKYPYCDPPLRGGTRLLYEEEGGGQQSLIDWCTGGFVARGRGPNHSLFLMTAGHCFEYGYDDLWTQTANHTPRRLGPFHEARDSGGVDAAIIRVLDESYWKARSWISMTSGPGVSPNAKYPIYNDASSIVGMQVCVAGSWNGYANCGPVTQVQVNENFVKANICSIHGDSGGPIFAGNTAYGLLSSADDGTSRCTAHNYMAIQPAENAMNVDVTHATPPPNPASPPVAHTSSASGIQPSQASLVGTVNPQGSATEYYFEYGTTTDYGAIVPAPDGDAGAGTSAAQFQSSVGGLLPETVYHFRIVASSEGGTSYGADQTFRTASRLDFSGDGEADVLARTPEGAMFLYRGNGQGGWASNGEVIGSGWNSFNAILSPGDFSGDGKADVLARTPDGSMRLYLGNGAGGWLTNGAVIGSGWHSFNAIVNAQLPIGSDTLGVFAPSVGHWCLSNRTISGTATCDIYHAVLGGSVDQAVAGDWNGDGIDSPGVFNPSVGQWCLSNRTISGDPECDLYESLGSSGDKAVAGDWNGDGIDTLGVFNPTVGQWCLSNRTTSGTATCDLYESLGSSSDKAVAGDWNGDGIDTLGVFAPSIGHWCLSNRITSGTATCDIYHAVLGGSADQPVAGDWNRDGIDSPGVFNPGVGQWCLSNRTISGDPECDLYESLGPGSKPVVGDWDGN